MFMQSKISVEKNNKFEGSVYRQLFLTFYNFNYLSTIVHIHVITIII